MRQLFRRITTISATCALAVSAAAAVAVAAEPTTGNILTGKLPTTNSTHLIGDGDTGFGPTDSNITKIIAGEENGSAENNGYASWDDVYLQYDFGEPREIHSINLYRNGYENALNTFKRIKVEASPNEDFSDSNVLFGTADVEETAATKLTEQTINLTTPVTARTCASGRRAIASRTRTPHGRDTATAWACAKSRSSPSSRTARPCRTCRRRATSRSASCRMCTASPRPTSRRSATASRTTTTPCTTAPASGGCSSNTRTATASTRLKPGTYPLVRIGVSSTPTSAGKDVDGMHSRPMFPILETQVGGGWVGDVDYTKQATKQDSNFLVDWVRVYQSEGQPVTRFDDLDGAESGAYRIAPASRTEGLTAVSNGDAAWQNKNNFYYGGQRGMRPAVPMPCP